MRPFHVRRALARGGGGSGSGLRAGKGAHFGVLLESFSEGRARIVMMMMSRWLCVREWARLLRAANMRTTTTKVK